MICNVFKLSDKKAKQNPIIALPSLLSTLTENPKARNHTFFSRDVYICMLSNRPKFQNFCFK